MSIDIGASSREEVLRDFRVRMAAPVVPDVTFEYQEKHDLMIGKAFDCRLGCASILRTLDNLRDKTLNVDVTGAFAVQEEMGTRRATVTANTVKPDLAIVFEGCPADDTVAEPYMIQTAIHKGPMLRHIDARMITNPRFQRYALDLAEELGISRQHLAAIEAPNMNRGLSLELLFNIATVLEIEPYLLLKFSPEK